MTLRALHVWCTTGNLSLSSGAKVEGPHLVLSWDGGFGAQESWDFLYLSRTPENKKLCHPPPPSLFYGNIVGVSEHLQAREGLQTGKHLLR